MVRPELLDSVFHLLLNHSSVLVSSRTQLLFSPKSSCRNKPILIPLRTAAILPRNGAKIAELSSAYTRHVKTSVVKFDDSATSRTGLPSLFESQGSELKKCFAVGAFAEVGTFLATAAYSRKAGHA